MGNRILCGLTVVGLALGICEADINTVAGNGTPGFSGDGGPATEAQLNRPAGVYWNGNLYIADADNGCVRKVDAMGIITTIAGTGVEGFSGDDGPATGAQLNRPHAVWGDTSGTLYISDTRNHRIRKVDVSGVITTVVGTGVEGFSGDDGPATGAQLNRPHGICLDKAGNLYVADTNNHRIRKVDVSGVVTSFAGTGTAGFSGDGGPAAEAQLNGPVAVVVDSSGVVYISDRTSARIRKVDVLGMISTVGGNGEASGVDGTPASEAALEGPRGIAIDTGGTLYFSENKHHLIRKIDPQGVLTTAAGNRESGFSGDNGPATDASLNFPWGVFVTGTGTLYIADRSNHRIRAVTPEQVVPASDFNADGAVDFQDFLLFVEHYGARQGQETYASEFDLNSDGEIGFPDFLVFAQAFGN